VSAREDEIVLNNQEEALQLFGKNGELRKFIQSEIPVQIVDRGATVAILGKSSDVAKADLVLREMLDAVRGGHAPTRHDVDYVVREAKRDMAKDVSKTFLDVIKVSRGGPVVRPRTRGQQTYIEAVREHDIVFCIGPAGTGKTYLAMAMAIRAMRRREVKRLIMCRPAVEAGESLGFLPGDLEQKVNPYLRPLYDALYAMMDVDEVRKLIDSGGIEVAPLAYMRGRTLDGAFVILDEGQNTSIAQMKMFLTRLGAESKTIITGDVTQVDLPDDKKSGLIHAVDILSGTKDIGFIHLTRDDVVRHRLVRDIIDAYERDTTSDDVVEKTEQS
jgi:phosphate starvation-inducible PhoH-like protein